MEKIENNTVQGDYNDRQKELFLKKSARIAASYLRRLEDKPDTIAALEPFFKTLRDIYINLNAIKQPGNIKTIGTFCAMVPGELIYAAGAMPVKLCSGNYAAYTIGDGIVPRDACPLVKAISGTGYTDAIPAFRDPALMVVPVSCDCKKKLAGMLKKQWPAVSLQIPVSRREDMSLDQYVNELYQLIPVLEDVTGRKITAETLAKSIDLVGYAQYEMSRFLALRRNSLPLLYGSQVMAVMNSYAFMDAAKWAVSMQNLNDELERRLVQKKFVGKKNQPKILLTGSPIIYPNIKIPLLIEELGGAIVGDETCMGERFLYDPLVVIDKSYHGMIRAMAARYIRPCTCPTFTDNEQRIHRIKQMVKVQQVQGVIYHVLRGCLVYDYEYQIFEEVLEEMDIPVIRLESDYNEEDVEQLKIRIEAFIEMIKMKELGNKRKR